MANRAFSGFRKFSNICKRCQIKNLAQGNPDSYRDESFGTVKALRLQS